MLRSSVTSPLRASFRPGGAKSILKRPAALPLSPAAMQCTASFSVLATPGGSTSPHVSFMKSPALVATFATFSAETYDRAPIRVSPQALALPPRGARFYSPTVDHFKLAAAPPPKAAAASRLSAMQAHCASPAITDFADPRSPQGAAQPAAPAAQTMRFASFAAPRTPAPLAQALGSYPRSPYPSAPLSPKPAARGRRLSDTTTGARPARAAVPPSPLQASFKSPGLQRAHRPAPLALEADAELSNAFWNAMTLEGDTPMVTALEFPESASAGLMDVSLKSPAPALKSPGPALMFGVQDGSVWSPAPRKHAAREELRRNALMSPARAAFARPKPVRHGLVASPSPSDPFAAFPSFAAVLSLDPLAVPAAARCA